VAEIIAPQRNEIWFNADRTPTLRFAEVIEDIINNLNPTVTSITAIDDGISESALALAGDNRKLIDEIISTAQAPLNAKIGQLEKRINDLIDNQSVSNDSKIGQLENRINDLTNNQAVTNVSSVSQLNKRLNDLLASQIIPIQDDTAVNDLITIQQTMPNAAIGEIEKRVNFIEGNM